MKEKKRISACEFHESMKAMRKRPYRPEFIEKFNKIMEEDIKREQEEKQKQEQEKKIAHTSEEMNS